MNNLNPLYENVDLKLLFYGYILDYINLYKGKDPAITPEAIQAVEKYRNTQFYIDTLKGKYPLDNNIISVYKNSDNCKQYCNKRYQEFQTKYGTS